MGTILLSILNFIQHGASLLVTKFPFITGILIGYFGKPLIKFAGKWIGKLIDLIAKL